jgi:hypothetical protein
MNGPYRDILKNISLRTGHFEGEHEDDIELVRDFEKSVLLVKGEGSSVQV